ncbi:hypothetical protein SDC9_169094 [bioreactor metagenome]|uniref:Uncharacterized protein n=1 Tax=bioreactor metagenome TaxID=1076179 RepID=A0A645GCI1_9ZZZZ
MQQQQRSGHSLTAAPFFADFSHGGAVIILALGNQARHQHRRNQQNQQNDADDEEPDRQAAAQHRGNGIEIGNAVFFKHFKPPFAVVRCNVAFISIAGKSKKQDEQDIIMPSFAGEMAVI